MLGDCCSTDSLSRRLPSSQHHTIRSSAASELSRRPDGREGDTHLAPLIRSHANLSFDSMLAFQRRLKTGLRETDMLRGYAYQLYEAAHAALVPARAVSDAAHFIFSNPLNPLSETPFGKNVAAGAELFERMTRRYGKPIFGLKRVAVDGIEHGVREDIVWSRPFCNLLHFACADFPAGLEQLK